MTRRATLKLLASAMLFSAGWWLTMAGVWCWVGR